jgi:radical SAM protein with 4Fe4S-binding SPASM domain
MNGLKLLAKKCPEKVIWTFIVFSHNEHQLALAQKIADDLDIRIGFKPAYFINDNVKKEMLPKNQDYWRITVNSDGDEAHIAKRKACREFWETIYVIPNGDVVTCCYDFNAQMVMGNANNNTIPEIWNGPEYTKLREEHLKGNLAPLCAKHCYLPK